jgi:ATP:ADP antiporter, AAA family
MIHRSLIKYFYPDLSYEEMRKYWLLSLIFVVIIGTYWLLRLLKNTIFLKVAFPLCFGWDLQQGCLYLPYAKAWSSIAMLAVLLVYSKLIDILKPHQMFYIFSGFYSIFFGLFAALLGLRQFYGIDFLGKTVLASLGWVSYAVIESYDSLLVAFFWGFCNSIVNSDSAEQGFPLIVAMAQLSAILGSSSLLLFAGSSGSLWFLMLAASFLVALIIPFIKYFMKEMSHDPLVTTLTLKDPEDKKDGFLWSAFEGIYLIMTRPYLFGILVISVIYEAVSVILDYQMNAYASNSPLFSSEMGFATFQSLYGIGVSIFSLFVALFVTSNFLSRFGPRLGLLLYPLLFSLSLAILLGCFYHGVSSERILWVIFGVMVLIKGVGYSLNSPVTEMMFITTSKKANYKSKIWIDTFASRFAKAGGSGVTTIFQSNMAALLLYGSFVGFGLVAIWIVAAIYVGYRNSVLRQRNEIIA